MTHTTLISPQELRKKLMRRDWAVIDCRFSLNDPGRGRRDYLEAHIPRALYAHLEEDLTGPIVPRQTGRHPLPDPAVLSHTFSQWGIEAKTQVVGYDDTGGSIAARLWWCLHWLGHEAVAVLDGGWQAWQQAGHPTTSGLDNRPEAQFEPRPVSDLQVDAREVRLRSGDPDWTIVDSRAPERYRGEEEPLDPIAGRIPGAINFPHTRVLGADGRFLKPEELAARFQELLGQPKPAKTIFYCGSGVTAARNVLAMHHAGWPGSRLYAGSWSEWITDRQRPISKG